MQRKKVINSRNKRVNVKLMLTAMGVVVIVVGVIITVIHNINNTHIKKVDNDSINYFFYEKEDIEEKKTANDEIIKYVAVLEIPTINLEQGIPYPDSKDNTVDRNIQIIKPFDYPNVEAGNFILASHSGSSVISYFKKLDKLKVNDEVYIYYDGKKYEYKINKIYESDKYQVSIKRDHSKSTLTLTTCSKESANKQLVLIAYLIGVSNY